MRHYQLAQFNIARMLAPIDSPVMAGFVSQLPVINELADCSSGFVWRLQTAEGDATAVRIYDDPLIIVNMSVWESIDSLRNFAYKSAHAGPLRDRLQWFERPKEAHLCMWWIPAGHIPTVEEGRDRLAFRRAHGDTPVAFSFAKPHPAPDEPAGDSVAPQISFDNRQFISTANTSNGDCDAATRFRYRQDGARIWATYEGGHVQFGTIVAIADLQGRLDMRYQHVDASGDLRTGSCTSTPEVLADGRVRLHEEWRWTNGDLSSGRSIVEEVRA